MRRYVFQLPKSNRGPKYSIYWIPRDHPTNVGLTDRILWDTYDSEMRAYNELSWIEEVLGLEEIFEVIKH